MSIPPVAGPYLAAVVILGVAGAAKVVRPHDTAVAVRAAGFPLRLSRTEQVVRAGALAEVVVAGAALATPGPVAPALVAASYLIFAVFIVTALVRHWPIASCGCFGRPDTQPSVAHVLVNGAALLTAVWWAVAAPGAVGSALSHQPGDGVPLALGALVCAGLAVLVLTNPLVQARHAVPVAGPPTPRRSP